jgi:uncharacterized protein (DUF1330 family)
MSAYFIVQSTIGDEVGYQQYREAVFPPIMYHGGKFVVKGAPVELLEGHQDGRRMVMFEFPSMHAIHAFWNSFEYVPVKEIRKGSATLDIRAVPGA